MNKKHDKATEVMWERIAVALAVGGCSMSKWATEIGIHSSTLGTMKNRVLVPSDRCLDLLCEVTGCTRDFLFNPEPIDLSK